MRCQTSLISIVLMVASSMARGDILPVPDRGPPVGRAGGLDFAVETVETPPVAMPPSPSAPLIPRYHYNNPQQVVVLVGCVEVQPNCRLARSRNLVGMEVRAVEGASLRPDKGMIRQIMDAFEGEPANRTVTLELFSHERNDETARVAFAVR